MPVPQPLRLSARAATCTFALSVMLVGCGGHSHSPTAPRAAGPTVVRGQVWLEELDVDSLGTVGLRFDSGAVDGIRVWLARSGRVVDSSYTQAGFYAFAVRETGNVIVEVDAVPGFDYGLPVHVAGDTVNVEGFVVYGLGSIGANPTGTPTPFSTTVSVHTDNVQSLFDIYDLRGGRLRSYPPAYRPSGHAVWDGRDSSGAAVPDGFYFGHVIEPVLGEDCVVLHKRTTVGAPLVRRADAGLPGAGGSVTLAGLRHNRIHR